MNQGTRCTEINEIQPETAGSLQSTNWSTSLLGESTNANFLLPGSSTITSCAALGMLFVSCLCELVGEWAVVLRTTPTMSVTVGSAGRIKAHRNCNASWLEFQRSGALLLQETMWHFVSHRPSRTPSPVNSRSGAPSKLELGEPEFCPYSVFRLSNSSGPLLSLHTSLSLLSDLPRALSIFLSHSSGWIPEQASISFPALTPSSLISLEFTWVPEKRGLVWWCHALDLLCAVLTLRQGNYRNLTKAAQHTRSLETYQALSGKLNRRKSCQFSAEAWKACNCFFIFYFTLWGSTT